MSDRVNEATKMFEEGFVCSQAVFAAFSDLFGLEKDLALKIGNGFGGGVARKQELCGAVTGGIMLIGLKCGKTEPKDNLSHENTYDLINSYCEKFINRNGSINCYDLLGCNLSEAKEKGLFTTSCRKFVKDSAEIIDEMIANDVEINSIYNNNFTTT